MHTYILHIYYAFAYIYHIHTTQTCTGQKHIMHVHTTCRYTYMLHLPTGIHAYVTHMHT